MNPRRQRRWFTASEGVLIDLDEVAAVYDMDAHGLYGSQAVLPSGETVPLYQDQAERPRQRLLAGK